MPNSFDRDRDYRARSHRQHDFDLRGQGQPQQFQDDYRQQDWEGGSDRFGGSMPRSQGSAGQSFREDRPREYQQRDYDPLGDYDRASSSLRGGSYGGRGPSAPSQSYFRGDDFGGRDFSAGSMGSYGTRPSQMSGYGGGAASRSGSDWSIPPRRYDPNDRGFFDRASDEVMSWFGDDDAANRRRRDHNDHRGRGPSNYTKSDERLLEDACERLTSDYSVDASNINVTVASGEVTLDGTVDSRQAKRRAEDCVDEISGVKHVQNNLRVVETGASWNAATSTSDRDAQS